MRYIGRVATTYCMPTVGRHGCFSTAFETQLPLPWPTWIRGAQCHFEPRGVEHASLRLPRYVRHHGAKQRRHEKSFDGVVEVTVGNTVKREYQRHLPDRRRWSVVTLRQIDDRIRQQGVASLRSRRCGTGDHDERNAQTSENMPSRTDVSRCDFGEHHASAYKLRTSNRRAGHVHRCTKLVANQ